LNDLGSVRLSLVEDFQDIRDLEAWLLSGPLQHGRMAVDTEGTGLSPERDSVRLVQIGDRTQGWALPWDGWWGLFEAVMTRFAGTIHMHNAPYDFAMLKKMGVRLDPGRIQDTRVKAHILEPTMPTALKKQASRHVDPRAGAAQKDLDGAISKLGWAGVPVKFGPYWQYGALDPVLTFSLDDVLSPRIEEQGAQKAFEVENAVQFVLEKMMRRGALTDVGYAVQQRARFEDYCQRVEKWCHDEYRLSPGSNAAVVRVLQDAGYTFSKITASGVYALDKEVLEDVDHPLAKAVLKRRQLQKLSTTYLDHFIHESIDGVIHPSINSLGARTGRMSVSSPNMQNLPRVSENNPAANIVRNCIVARPGHTLVFCDFSQVETRLLAHLSQDAGLIEAFHSDDDFFVTIARRVFGDDTIGKKDPRRNVIKTLIYAKIYGAGLDKMAKTLGFTFAQMQSVDNALSTAYPGIRRFQNETRDVGFKNKSLHGGDAFVVCPLSGRRHYADRGKEYALVNYLIQGMAAFFFKTKLLELDAAGLDEWMILPVHDEIILDVPNAQVPYTVGVLTQVMNDRSTFLVPIAAEVSYGHRWGEKHDWNQTEWETTCSTSL